MILFDALNWIIGHPSSFFGAFNRHRLMCAISLFAALNIAGALRSIPSLAILSAAMPILGIGLLPSVIALIVLAVAPFLINTVIGVREIDPAVLAAANGMGMGRRELLWQIE